MQVIERSKRHHAIAANGHDPVGIFCCDFPLRILNPRQDFVLGIDTVGNALFLAIGRQDVYSTELTVIIALALICSAYGFITQAYVQPHVPAETTGFAFSLEPVCSAVFSFFLVGEILTPIAFLGAALIMAGVFVATIEPPRLHAPVYSQEAMAVEPKRVS